VALDAETSPERGFYYSASKHSAGKPIVAGWSYSWITALDWAHDSWTAPMDARRIPPGRMPTVVWNLPRKNASDGPTFIFGPAPHQKVSATRRDPSVLKAHPDLVTSRDMRMPF
jgi:hypothetical protein